MCAEEMNEQMNDKCEKMVTAIILRILPVLKAEYISCHWEKHTFHKCGNSVPKTWTIHLFSLPVLPILIFCGINKWVGENLAPLQTLIPRTIHRWKGCLELKELPECWRQPFDFNFTAPNSILDPTNLGRPSRRWMSLLSRITNHTCKSKISQCCCWSQKKGPQHVVSEFVRSNVELQRKSL